MSTTTPKAYSYIRFSTPEQASGDSYRRQAELSNRHAEEHGLNLDTSLSLCDLGVSGFTRENRSKGALALSLKAVETGKVPAGSFLLVESLDRLSREERSFGRVFNWKVMAGAVVQPRSGGEHEVRMHGATADASPRKRRIQLSSGSPRIHVPAILKYGMK